MCIRDRGDPAVYEAGLARLKQMIHESVSGESLDQEFESPLVAKLDPFDFGAFLNTKRKNFHGRQWLFDEIDRWRSEDQDRALLITGDPGAGKSSIVAELVYGNPDGQVVAYHCCQSNVPETRRPGKFVRSLATMLASQIPEYSAAIERGRPLDALMQADVDPETAFEHGVLAPLASIEPPPGPAHYILIDALDEALGGAQATGTMTILDPVSYTHLAVTPALVQNFPSRM